MCMFVADASKPNPSLCLWLSLDKPVGCLDLARIDLILAGLNVNRHKLVRLRIDVDVWAHALLEYCISPQEYSVALLPAPCRANSSSLNSCASIPPSRDCQ